MIASTQTQFSKPSGMDLFDSLKLVVNNSQHVVEKEEDKTLALYQSSLVTMQQQIRSLASEIQDLRSQLVTVDSHHRELELLHVREVMALQEKVKTSEDVVEAMRKEMENTMQKADEMVRAALAEKEAAVKAATELADARVTAAKQEVETRIRTHYTQQLQQVCSTLDGWISNLNSNVQFSETTIKSQERSGMNPAELPQKREVLKHTKWSKEYFENIRGMLKAIK